MYKRSDRVGELLRGEITRIVQREMKNPKLGFVTITEVKVTDDLKFARVYYSVYGSEKNKKETAEILKVASSFIRRQIGGKIKLKHIPRIDFFYDRTPEQAAHISELIEKIKRKEK